MLIINLRRGGHAIYYKMFYLLFILYFAPLLPTFTINLQLKLKQIIEIRKKKQNNAGWGLDGGRYDCELERNEGLNDQREICHFTGRSSSYILIQNYEVKTIKILNISVGVLK